MAAGSAALEAPTVQIRDATQWAALLHLRHRPLLVHLNGDSTWLIQLPRPAGEETSTRDGTGTSQTSPPRSHFNILVDPWLNGPQSDVASWFSSQWHVVAPAVATIDDLQAALGQVEDGGRVDAVAISHEFTDHCHQATLEELPRDVPVYAADYAAKLIRGWNHFDSVITAPGLAKGNSWQSLPGERLPSWLRIGRIVTPGNSLYYHSAFVIAFSQEGPTEEEEAEAIIYSPHGIQSKDLEGLGAASNLRTLALLHGLHDVSIFMTKQLNLGALNAMEAVYASNAKYWVATHDEVKTGAGLIAPLLRRTVYSFAQAVDHAEKKFDGGKDHEYCFMELASGEATLLE
ncbi:hypothetical protein K4F52_009383 [Lecanicillium sp. MT-2017a]|nr:hypothetical protein K4F52_009383 [Lecanicillium sp. MT-2017a]